MPNLFTQAMYNSIIPLLQAWRGSCPCMNMAIKLNCKHQKMQFKHHQMGLLIIKICYGKSFDTLGCNKAFAFIPTTRMLDFIVGEEGKDGGQCRFLCKKTSATLTMICNNCEQIVLLSFRGSNFNLYYISTSRFAYILYMFKCDVHHLMN